MLKIKFLIQNKFRPPSNCAAAPLCPLLLYFLQLRILYYCCLQSAFYLSAYVFTKLNQLLWFHAKTSIPEIFLAVNATYFLQTFLLSAFKCDVKVVNFSSGLAEQGDNYIEVCSDILHRAVICFTAKH